MVHNFNTQSSLYIINLVSGNTIASLLDATKRLDQAWLMEWMKEIKRFDLRERERESLLASRYREIG